MPSHMAGAVAPAAACPAKVSQRNAPGAMSAMAFIVSPVKPNVGFISADASAIEFFLLGDLTEELRAGFQSHIEVDRSQNLARTGLKTIVVMAGGCALQASPHKHQ